jgi:two-component system sensor histidine kinase UhpB
MTDQAIATSAIDAARRALRRPSIRRIAISGAVAVTLSLFGVVAAMFIVNARWSAQQEVDAAMAMAATHLQARRARIALAADPMAEAAAVADELSGLRHVSIRLLDADGAALIEPAADQRQAPTWFRSLIGGVVDSIEMPIVRYPNIVGALVLQTEPTDEIDEVWEDFSVIMPTILGAGVFALGVSLATILVVMRNVADVGAALQAMRSGDATARVAHQRFSEFAALADDANALAAHLAAERQENHRLLVRMMSLSEDERRALADDLHDVLGPSLFALRAAIRTASDAAATPEALANALAAAERHSETVQATCRAAIEALRPMLLGEASLEELLQDFSAGFRTIAPAARVSVTADRALPRSLGDLGDLCVFRFAQESVLNAVRHGGAQRIEIVLRRVEQADAAALLATVRDDGVGPTTADVTPRHGQLGMADRARALGGAYTPPVREGGAIITTLSLPL